MKIVQGQSETKVAQTSWHDKPPQAVLEADCRKDEFLATLAHELPASTGT